MFQHHVTRPFIENNLSFQTYSMTDSVLAQGHLSNSTGATKTDFVKLSDFICHVEVQWVRVVQNHI